MIYKDWKRTKIYTLRYITFHSWELFVSLSFRCSCREHAWQPTVPSRLGLCAAGPLRLHYLRDHEWGVECGGPAQWLRYEPLTSPCFCCGLYVWCACLHIYVCLTQLGGWDTRCACTAFQNQEERKRKEKKCAHASVIIFLCTCLSFSVDLCQ